MRAERGGPPSLREVQSVPLFTRRAMRLGSRLSGVRVGTGRLEESTAWLTRVLELRTGVRRADGVVSFGDNRASVLQLAPMAVSAPRPRVLPLMALPTSNIDRALREAPKRDGCAVCTWSRVDGSVPASAVMTTPGGLDWVAVHLFRRMLVETLVLPVLSVDAALPFYVDCLGLTLQRRATLHVDPAVLDSFARDLQQSIAEEDVVNRRPLAADRLRAAIRAEPSSPSSADSEDASWRLKAALSWALAMDATAAARAADPSTGSLPLILGSAADHEDATTDGRSDDGGRDAAELLVQPAGSSAAHHPSVVLLQVQLHELESLAGGGWETVWEMPRDEATSMHAVADALRSLPASPASGLALDVRVDDMSDSISGFDTDLNRFVIMRAPPSAAE